MSKRGLEIYFEFELWVYSSRCQIINKIYETKRLIIILEPLRFFYFPPQ